MYHWHGLSLVLNDRQIIKVRKKVKDTSTGENNKQRNEGKNVHSVFVL